ncbi:MAG: hypothetical protein WDZ62_00075 [Candidatus Pacearchaeota archaeon]
MAYKKYIKRGGKVYGPYIYHSKRVDGKVVSEYRGQERLSYKKISLAVFGILILVAIVFFSFSDKSPTGMVSLDLESDFREGNMITGILNLSLEEGDFVPSSSVIVFENEGSQKEYSLENTFNNIEFTNKTIYPTVYFNSSIVLEEVTYSNETGEIINGSENISTINFSATISRNREYTHNLSENMSGEFIIRGGKEYILKEVRIVPESIRTSSGNFLNQSDIIGIDISKENNVIFSTDYSEKIEGVEGGGIFEVNLSDFNLSLSEGTFIVKIVHLGDDIVSFETFIDSEGNFLNDTSISFEDSESDVEREDNIDFSNPDINQEEDVFLNEEKYNLELNENESSILLESFGKDSVEVDSAVERNGFIVLRYELGNYYSEFAYDSDLSNESLNLFIERDRIGWLKDIAKSLSNNLSDDNF